MIDGAASSGEVHENSVAAQNAATTSGFGMLVFLASDLMLFAGFFAAYFMLRGESEVWPPPGVELDVTLAAVSTALLVLSSLALYGATRAHRKSPPRNASGWLALTAILGTVFLFNQVRDYMSVDFSISDSAYGAIYWSLTALDGLHVLVGVGLILLLMWRISKPTANEAPLATTAYFWHMVVAVSVVVFLVVFVVQ